MSFRFGKTLDSVKEKLQMNADNSLLFKEYNSNCSQRYDSGISSISEVTNHL